MDKQCYKGSNLEDLWLFILDVCRSLITNLTLKCVCFILAVKIIILKLRLVGMAPGRNIVPVS